MSNAAEGKLARLIQHIASTETELENNRLRLAKNSSFDPFQNFRELDRSGKGYLDERDLADLLRSYKLSCDPRDFDPLLSLYKDGMRKITFQDFLRHISPKSDPSLKNVFLNRFGNARSGPQSGEDTQRVIATIYQKEVDYYREVENQKHSLSETPGLDEVVYSISDGASGGLTFQSVSKFMSRQHYNFTVNDFDSLVRRLDTSKQGRISLNDFNNFINPLEFQSSSNYSIGNTGNYKYEGQGSIFDSMSSPIRDVTSFNHQNIKINETYVPSTTTMGAYHSIKHSPLKAAHEVTVNKIVTTAPSHHVHVVEEQRPSYEVRRVNVDQIYERPPHIITRSPVRHEIQENYYSSKVAAIREHPLYHQPPPPAHVVTTTVTREIPERITTHLPPPTRLITPPPVSSHVVVENVRREIPERIVPNIPPPSRLVTSQPISSHVVVENVRRGVPDRIVPNIPPPTRLTHTATREVPERLVTTHHVSPSSKLVTPSRYLGAAGKEYIKPSYIPQTLPSSRGATTIDTKNPTIGGSTLKSYPRPPTLLGREDLKTNVQLESRLKDEKTVSVSPIKRRSSVDVEATAANKNYQYITPNLPPRYQSSNITNNEENPRLSHSKDAPTVPYTSKYTSSLSNPKAGSSLPQAQSSNYTFGQRTTELTSHVPKLSSYPERNPRISDNLLGARDVKTSYVLNDPRPGGLRSDIHHTSKQETFSKDTGPDRLGGIAKQEGIRHSTVLESYRNENAQRSGSISRPSHTEERTRPVYENPVKTEGDQVTAASSYKFANSKYEQLWGPEPNQD